MQGKDTEGMIGAPRQSCRAKPVNDRTPRIILKFNACKCRSQWPCGLRRGSWPIGCWDRGLESRSKHGCVVLCCPV
jgi:hypothetical protein